MIGDSISKGFNIATKSLNLVLVLFVFGAIFNILSILWTPADLPAGALPPPQLIALGVIFIFLTVFLQAGSMGYVRDAIKTGAHSMASFAANGGRYYLRLFLLGLVVSLVIGVFVLLAALSANFLQGIPVLGVLLAILFAALGIYFVILFFFAPYAAVVDEKGVGESLKLSMKLVKKNIFPLIGMSLLLIAIGFGIGLVLGALFAGISLVIKSEQTAAMLFAVLSSFVNAMLGVFVTAAFMNYYLRLDKASH